MSAEDDDDPLAKARKLKLLAETAADNKIVPLSRKREERQKRNAGRQEREKRDRTKKFKTLPDDCPVRPLGVNQSDYYFLDAIDQLIVKPSEKMGTNAIDDLFKDDAAQAWAENNFPRYSMLGEITGIDRDRLRRALMSRCGDLSRNGIFEPSNRVRGDGAWRDDFGHLVFHCGDVVLTADGAGMLYESRPGIRDHHIYPKGGAQLRPAAATVDYQPALELLQLLKTWNFKRGELDARLMLGWIVLAPVAGALRWRPAAWITGDMGTGKSTLQETIVHTLGGEDSVIQAADATGAGIWQALQCRSLPVILDEIEAATDNTKKEAIMTLMRISASGARIRRGGQDHQKVTFSAFSAFLFSSINILPLAPQDMSRLAFLELLELPKDQPRPTLEPARLARIGANLRRRVIMAWPRWAEMLQPWTDPLEKEFDRRTADTFGYLLAMADLALNDEPAPADYAEEILAPLMPSLRQWRAVAGRDDQLMLDHLASWQLDPWDRGRKVTVRQIIYWASDYGQRLPPDTSAARQEEEFYGATVPQTKAGEALRRHGLAVIRVRTPPTAAGEEYLAIAFRHAALKRIFKGTKWQDSVWRQSATRVPGALDQRKTRLQSTMPESAVLIPIAAVLGGAAAEPTDSDAAGAPPA